MTLKLTRQCAPGEDQPIECNADFTINGQAGHQKLRSAGTVTLVALWQEPQAAYRWDVTGSPPNCQDLLTHLNPYSVIMQLPGPGAYVVQLTVTKGECLAQTRYILWVVTPRLLYSIPATDEALRYDGQTEWAGDLPRLILDVDNNLPTEAQKAALDKASQPGTDNPFATLEDLSNLPGEVTGDFVSRTEWVATAPSQAGESGPGRGQPDRTFAPGRQPLRHPG
jgi:hypothetical protein